MRPTKQQSNDKLNDWRLPQNNEIFLNLSLRLVNSIQCRKAGLLCHFNCVMIKVINTTLLSQYSRYFVVAGAKISETRRGVTVVLKYIRSTMRWIEREFFCVKLSLNLTNNITPKLSQNTFLRRFTSAHDFPLRAWFHFIAKQNLIHSLIAATQKSHNNFYCRIQWESLSFIWNFYVKPSLQIFSNIKLMFDEISAINFQIICWSHLKFN